MRTFIALEISDESRSSLAQLIESIKPELGKLSWVKPENIHLTMKFIGEIDEKMIPDIERELNHVAAKTSVMSVNIRSLGCFPNPRRARVLWAGLRGNLEQLEFLKRDVEESMTKIGLEKDNKKFSPHVTLARIKKPVDTARLTSILKEHDNSDYGKEEFDHIALIKSDLTPSGANYTRLFKADFPK